MMKNITRVLSLIARAIPLGLLGLFVACAEPQVSNQVQAIDEKDLRLITIISSDIRFYDFGVLREEPELGLEIFQLGKSLGRFVIREKEVCFLDNCMAKWPASKRFFGNVSYDDLFEDILRGEDIFDGQGKRVSSGGAIIQEFEFGGEKIYYERSENRIYFKNYTNGVLFSIENYIK